jgi:hypothetical protein
MGRHIARHDSSSADECMLPDHHATDNDSSRARCGSPLNSGRQQFSAVALYVRADGGIGEEDTGSNKYVISDVDALEDHHLVFSGDTVADPGAVLHKGSVTDVAVASDARASQDVGECP